MLVFKLTEFILYLENWYFLRSKEELKYLCRLNWLQCVFSTCTVEDRLGRKKVGRGLGGLTFLRLCHIFLVEQMR